MALSRDRRGEAGRISDTADRGQVGQITHPARDPEGEEFKGKDRTDRRKRNGSDDFLERQRWPVWVDMQGHYESGVPIQI